MEALSLNAETGAITNEQGWPVELAWRDEGGRVMDEYTPTTEDVIRAYVDMNAIVDMGGPSAIAAERHELTAEFDRWMATHDTEVARAAAEKAWDEGRDIGASAEAECCGSCPRPGPCGKEVALLTTNPYRADRLAAGGEDRG